MRWKPAWLEKVKPASWSAHGGWGCVIGMMLVVVKPETGPRQHICAAIIIGLCAGYLWEYGYWHVSRWFRKRRGIVYKARGWPDVPPDALVIAQPLVVKDLIAGSVALELVNRDIKKWCKRECKILNWQSVSTHSLSVRLYRHPAFDRRRGSKLDVIPWALGAALGAAFVCWRG